VATDVTFSLHLSLLCCSYTNQNHSVTGVVGAKDANARFYTNKREKWCVKCTSILNVSLSRQMEQCITPVTMLTDVRNEQLLV
jgi:uncharacterized protein YceK